MTEHELQNIILDYLNRLPRVFAWRNQSQGTYDVKRKVFMRKVGFAIKGTSDVLGVIAPMGTLLAVEVKKPGSTESSLSKEQKAYLNKVNAMGGLAFWADSLEVVKERLQEYLARWPIR